MKKVPSISSKSGIIERTTKYWSEENLWHLGELEQNFDKISKFLTNEYKLIPEKERIGKGRVFIIKSETYSYEFHELSFFKILMNQRLPIEH